MQYRFFEKFRINSVYISDIMVRMRSGGMSNSGLKGIYKSLRECYIALKMHNARFPFLYIINTVLYRIRQLPIMRKLKLN